jgi:uncharacterized protein (DUF302 family)
MKKIGLILITVILSFPISAQVNSKLTRIQSKLTFDNTLERLKEGLDQKGLGLFAEIDHRKSADKVGMELLPTTLLIFGNPKIGTKLMNCDQSIGIELPLKILVIQNEENEVFISYRDPQQFANQDQMEECLPTLEKIQNVLSGLAASTGQ